MSNRKRNVSFTGEIAMFKVLVGFSIALFLGFLPLGLMSAAQAYPDVPPARTLTPPAVTSQPIGQATEAEAAARSGTATTSPTTSAKTGLPGTGGPDVLVLAGGAALVLVGGVSVVAARRRQTH
jgi:hypothetical protein